MKMKQSDYMAAVKVIQWVGTNSFMLAEVPKPKPGPGEVVIRVRAAGVHPIETHRLIGADYRDGRGVFVPGLEAAGLVDAVGPEVPVFKPGNPVFTLGTLSGACAEFALCDWRQLFPLPERLPFSSGAVLGIPYAAACRALFDIAQIEPDEILLIHGASGGVGFAAVELAKRRGARIVGTAGSDLARRLIARQGAAGDVILEMRPDLNLKLDLTMLAREGRLVLIGGYDAADLEGCRPQRADAKIEPLRTFDTPVSEHGEASTVAL